MPLVSSGGLQLAVYRRPRDNLRAKVVLKKGEYLFTDTSN